MRIRLLTLVVFLILSFMTAKAQFVQYGSANIPNPHSIFHPQERPEWCWAACNQMLLHAVGILQTQAEQATKRQRMFGGTINQGAGGDYSQAAPCLEGHYVNATGQQVTVVPYISYLQQHNQSDAMVIIESLRHGIPVVMATTQHGRVCIGVDYATDGMMIQITTLRLLNPAHGLWPVPELDSVSMGQLVQEGLFGFMTLEIR
jgi:hypothetical protein